VVAQRQLNIPLLTQPIAKTPQTINVIPAEVINLGGLTDLRDVLRLDPSVSAHADEDSGQGTNVYIRGFSARFDQYRDGQLDPGQYYRDAFDLESVAVLTGPSGVLFGRGSTGGVINEISKHPLSAPYQSLSLVGGTDDFGRLAGDIDMVLGRASLRLNAMGETSGISGRDVVYGRRAGVAAALAIAGLTVDYMHQSQWDRPDYGLPWIDIAGQPTSHPAMVPWHNYYGFWDDYSDVTADIATVGYAHVIGGGWTVGDQLRIASYGRSFRIVEPTISEVVPFGTPLSSLAAARTVRGGSSHEAIIDNRVDLTGAFSTFQLSHTVVISADVGKQISNPFTLSFSHVSGTNLIDPDESQRFSGSARPKGSVRFTAQTAGLSAGDSIAFGRWRLDAAARVDRFAADYENTVPTFVAFHHVDIAPSYRLALNYAPAPAVNTYVMWGTSFDPSAESLSLSASTADLAPERNQTVEVGVKWTVYGGLTVSAALFRTTQFNTRENSPTDPTVTILAGTARAQGVELLAQGRIGRWLLQSGYTYLDAKIIASPNADVGQPLQNAPKHNLRLFAAYDLTSALTVGGAVQAQSSRVPSSFPDPNGFRQMVPGYATVSALVRYLIRPGVTLQLNAENLANARYYDGLDDNHVNPGAGRSVHLTLIVTRP
jgi:catecholate siderophore receptor